MSEYAQILLKSNSIFDGTGADPFAGYVAVANGKVLQVGKGEPASEWIGEDTTVYELGDKTVCPGFADAHTFFTG